MMVVRLFLTALIIMPSLCITAASGADSVVLITAEEAALPAQQNTELARRGITRGPQITLVSPAPSATSKSPVHLQFKFEGHGGAKVDPAAVKVTYLKNPAVDLSSRVKPFIQANGIDVGAAQMPPGNHVLRVDVKDTDGRVSTALFTLNVAQ